MWQWEPVRARVGVTESHREPERDRGRSSKSQREPVKAWESKLEPEGARVGATESHRCQPHIFSIRKHCFVAKQLNKTLFCRDTSKYGIFCRKLLKYALWAKKMAASAMRADSTLCPTPFGCNILKRQNLTKVPEIFVKIIWSGNCEGWPMTDPCEKKICQILTHIWKIFLYSCPWKINVKFWPIWKISIPLPASSRRPLRWGWTVDTWCILEHSQKMF